MIDTVGLFMLTGLDIVDSWGFVFWFFLID